MKTVPKFFRRYGSNERDSAAVDQQAEDHADESLPHVAEHDGEQEDEHDRHERGRVDRAVQGDA